MENNPGRAMVASVAIALLSSPACTHPCEAKDPKGCEASCIDGQAHACHTVATWYAYGRGVEKNWSKAIELYELSCKHGHAKGCFELGTFYKYGQDVPKDPARAVELYLKSCARGNTDGCTTAGLMLIEDPEKKARGDKILKRACERGDQRACKAVSDP